MIPDSKNEVWKKALLSDDEYQLEFLALKILISRLRVRVKLNPEPGAIEKASEELREAFMKYIHIPRVQNDLQKLEGRK